MGATPHITLNIGTLIPSDALLKRARLSMHFTKSKLVVSVERMDARTAQPDEEALVMMPWDFVSFRSV